MDLAADHQFMDPNQRAGSLGNCIILVHWANSTLIGITEEAKVWHFPKQKDTHPYFIWISIIITMKYWWELKLVKSASM